MRFLGSHKVPQEEIHDLINDAWLQGMETFDESKGLEEVQWVWWVLQRNILPGYGRKKKKFQFEYFSSDEKVSDPPESEESQSEHEADVLTRFLREHLPDDLATIFQTLLSMVEKTDSKHIYQETARQLNVSIEECRNRVKRLRRACDKLKAQWEKQQ